MKKVSKKSALILMTTGMFVIAASQIITHFVSVPDFMKGAFLGIGIGLLILSVTIGNFKTAQ